MQVGIQKIHILKKRKEKKTHLVVVPNEKSVNAQLFHHLILIYLVIVEILESVNQTRH